jgi:hypothetical protein
LRYPKSLSAQLIEKLLESLELIIMRDLASIGSLDNATGNCMACQNLTVIVSRQSHGFAAQRDAEKVKSHTFSNKSHYISQSPLHQTVLILRVLDSKMSQLASKLYVRCILLLVDARISKVLVFETCGTL